MELFRLESLSIDFRDDWLSSGCVLSQYGLNWMNSALTAPVILVVLFCGPKIY